MPYQPINQVFLGGGPMDTLDDIDAQINKMQAYRNKLRQMQATSQPQKLIWDDIDAEVEPMTDEQKSRLLQDEDYVETYTKIQNMVNAEILNLVKGRIFLSKFVILWTISISIIAVKHHINTKDIIQYLKSLFTYKIK